MSCNDDQSFCRIDQTVGGNLKEIIDSYNDSELIDIVKNKTDNTYNLDFLTFCELIEKIIFYKDETFLYLIGVDIPIKIEESLQYNRKNTGEMWIKNTKNRYIK